MAINTANNNNAGTECRGPTGSTAPRGGGSTTTDEAQQALATSRISSQTATVVGTKLVHPRARASERASKLKKQASFCNTGSTNIFRSYKKHYEKQYP